MSQPEPPTTTCPVCHQSTPMGEYCGACGTHLTRQTAGRGHAYAANPEEHLLHLNVISTLFPHLPRRHSAPFHVALLASALLLLVLGLLRLTGPQIAAASLVVPVLYLLYMYEVEVYEDEPVLAMGLTFVLGLLIGIPWALLTGPFITNTLVANATVGGLLPQDLVAGVLIPLAAQALMLIGALTMYFRRRYDEALDGFTFGAAGALGFTFANTVTTLWPQLQNGLVAGGPAVDNTLVVLIRGLLIPFITASTTGLIGAALWLRRGKTRKLAVHGWTTRVTSVVAAVILTWIFLGLINIFVFDPAVVAVIYAAAAALLLLAVRVALHHMLLTEAVEVSIGPPSVCSHCHYVVPRMAFCPHCGVATRATPKTGSGRLRRAFR